MTNGQFGPVSTSDDTNVISWDWEESVNGTDWAPAGTSILTDIDGENTNTLLINSGTLEENGTFVRCKAATSYAPNGVYSNSAQLFVTE